MVFVPVRGNIWTPKINSRLLILGTSTVRKNLGSSSLVSLNFLQRLVQQASAMALRGFPGGSPGPVIKKIIRIEVPIETYPNVISNYIRTCIRNLYFGYHLLHSSILNADTIKCWRLVQFRWPLARTTGQFFEAC